VLGPDEAVVSTVRRLSGGVHVAFEVVGAQAAFDQALACLRSGGELMLLGLVDRLCVPALDMVNAELRISTSVGYRDCHDEVIGLLAAGRLDLGALVTDVVALSDAPAALLRMATEGSRGVKTLVRCGGEAR
jgi:(R,R)-butanediol dehydrogenase/meso-butanediol dehydrogenase/diacetyl reductase